MERHHRGGGLRARADDRVPRGLSLIHICAGLALPTLDAAGFLVFGLIIVVGTFAAFALYLHGVSIVGSVKGSLLGAIEPVSATAFSALWLGTAFSGADWVGFVLMIAMIFLVTGEKPQSRREAEASGEVLEEGEAR